MPGGEATPRGWPAGADSGMLVREWQWGQWKMGIKGRKRHLKISISRSRR